MSKKEAKAAKEAMAAPEREEWASKIVSASHSEVTLAAPGGAGGAPSLVVNAQALRILASREAFLCKAQWDLGTQGPLQTFVNPQRLLGAPRVPLGA